MAYIQFLGAAGTVTGSKHLINTGDLQVLVDCGLFQGLKQWRERNWQPLPIPAQEIDAVVLTHAHLDHSGWIPRLIQQGFALRVIDKTQLIYPGRQLELLIDPDGRIHTAADVEIACSPLALVDVDLLLQPPRFARP